MTTPHIRDDVTKKFSPFMEEVLGGYRENIHSIFGRFFAMLAGVSNAAYYEVPQAEQAAPRVKF